jgi:hypothetical protein
LTSGHSTGSLNQPETPFCSLGVVFCGNCLRIVAAFAFTVFGVYAHCAMFESSRVAQAVQRARTREKAYQVIGDEVRRLGYHAAIFTLYRTMREAHRELR